MKKTSIAIAAVSLALLFGCRKQHATSSANSYEETSNPPAVAQANMTPEDLGALGAKIRKHPTDARELLSQQGLTEQSFEQAVRKVAESPEQSKRYAAAYKRSSS